MKSWKQIACLLVVTIATAFMISVSTAEQSEALCPKIGQFHSHGENGVSNTSGICKSATKADLKSGGSGFMSYISMMVYPLAGVGLAISVIMVVFAGYLYVTAGVDSKNVEKAKTLLISAGAGIFITLNIFIIAKMLMSLAGFM